MRGTEGVGGLTPGIAASRVHAAGWAGAMVASLLAALARPRWWALALAAFLVRGGIVVIVLPIVALPTFATLESLGSPIVVTLLGAPTPGLVLAAVLAIAILAAWVILAAAGGAWLELGLITEAALDEDLEIPPPRLVSDLRRAAIVRALAHLPTLMAVAYAAIRVGVETYAELFSPTDPAIEFAWRVVARVPDAILLLVVAWAIGEAAGGIAVRRVALGDGLRAALGVAVTQVARRTALATFAATNVGLALAVVAMWLASSRTWDLARVLLVDDAPVALLAAGVLLLVVTWALGVGLLAAALAWRSVAWTAETYRPTSVSTMPAAADVLRA